MDTWKEYGRHHPKAELVTRLSVVYKCAAKATFVTSLTTTIAFLSNVQSPLLAVSSFGLFSAILVAVNYCSCILFLPTVIIFHEQQRKGRCCFWSMCRRTKPEQPIGMQKRADIVHGWYPTYCGIHVTRLSYAHKASRHRKLCTIAGKFKIIMKLLINKCIGEIFPT